MVVGFFQQLVSEFVVVRQLAVEGERKPATLVEVMVLERLSVTFVVGSAGGITHVPNGNRTTVFAHQILSFRFVRQSKDFLHASDVAIGVQKLAVFSLSVVSSNPSRKLASILHVEQHSNDQRRGLFGIRTRAKFAGFAAGQMIDRRNATFVEKFTH